VVASSTAFNVRFHVTGPTEYNSPDEEASPIRKVALPVLGAAEVDDAERGELGVSGLFPDLAPFQRWELDVLFDSDFTPHRAVQKAFSCAWCLPDGALWGEVVAASGVVWVRFVLFLWWAKHREVDWVFPLLLLASSSTLSGGGYLVTSSFFAWVMSVAVVERWWRFCFIGRGRTQLL
jgi:hypothetical protein